MSDLLNPYPPATWVARGTRDILLSWADGRRMLCLVRGVVAWPSSTGVGGVRGYWCVVGIHTDPTTGNRKAYVFAESPFHAVAPHEGAEPPEGRTYLTTTMNLGRCVYGAAVYYTCGKYQDTHRYLTLLGRASGSLAHLPKMRPIEQEAVEYEAGFGVVDELLATGGLFVPEGGGIAGMMMTWRTVGIDPAVALPEGRCLWAVGVMMQMGRP